MSERVEYEVVRRVSGDTYTRWYATFDGADRRRAELTEALPQFAPYRIIKRTIIEEDVTDAGGRDGE